MSLALPPPSFRPLKGLALVLVAVLGLHAWLLGGMALPTLWAPSDTPQRPGTAVLQTRTVSATPPSPQAPTAAPKQAPLHTSPPAAAPQAGATLGLSASFRPLAHADRLSLAPESIASQTLPAAPQPQTVPQEPAQRYAFPPPVRLNYTVWVLNGNQGNAANAQLSWQHDGSRYQASLTVDQGLGPPRQWTSKGLLADTGLAPLRFGDRVRGREVAAHFVREEGKVVFSANTPEAPLQPGAQDRLSAFVQLASLWAGEPQRFAAGERIAFQSIGPRQSETWTFLVSAEDNITVPGGTLRAVKLTREPSGDYSTKAELWLAPTLAYLPAHIRLTESNGHVLDLQWADSSPP